MKHYVTAGTHTCTIQKQRQSYLPATGTDCRSAGKSDPPSQLKTAALSPSSLPCTSTACLTTSYPYGSALLL